MLGDSGIGVVVASRAVMGVMARPGRWARSWHACRTGTSTWLAAARM